MGATELDIAFIADARFPGGTSTALVNEIAAAARAGFSAGLLHVAGPLLRKSRGFHAGVRAAIDRGDVLLLDPTSPVRVRLAIVHHPMLFASPLERALDITADHCVMVAHHPAFDAAGEQQYDLLSALAQLQVSSGLVAVVAPVGPNVRKSLRASKVPLTAEDWHNLIDAPRWKRGFRPFGNPLVIGRHSRPDMLKWPQRRADLLRAYPPDPRYRIEILGAPPSFGGALRELPANWHIDDFGSKDVRQFLHGLDAYVYFHSSRWIEAFGYGVLEALACGLPTIVPRSFEPLFGDGAIYARPAEVAAILERLAADVTEQKRQQARALATASRYSLGRFAERLDAMFSLRPQRRLLRGLVPAGRRRVSAQPRQRTAMFMSSNGVGLGHLTRQMAIAARLPDYVQPVFFTLSRAARLVRERNYLVEHVPFHRYLGTGPEQWNPILERELALAMQFYRPEVLIFDGNVPYIGLVNALRKHRQMRSMWVRRGMWRDDPGGILKRSGMFDMVVEPGEFAGLVDPGPTRALRDQTLMVEPVMMIEPGERLGRGAARRALGVRSRLVVALQLGSGANFDFSAARERCLDRLLAMPRIEVVELLSPVTDDLGEPERLSERHHPMRLFPAYRLSRAFDAMICAAGYNSFHECIAGGIPTLFVANRAEEMDRQDLRADFASHKGVALSWSGLNMPGLERELQRLLDPARRSSLRMRMKQIPVPSGARQIAALIEELLLASRAARD